MTGFFVNVFALSACWLGAGMMDVVSAPSRPLGAPTGSSFIQSTFKMGEAQREEAIYRQIVTGNMPDFQRQLRPVTIRTKTRSGQSVTATIYVTPDYLSVGSDRDYVRVPMNPITAQRIASKLNMFLPTTKMVDAIYRSANVKLAPAPLPPGAQMTTSPYYQKHNTKIEQQLARHGTGKLVAGHKKDVVLSNRLTQRPGRVAIYGWHRTSGRPIQPLSLVHHDRYADYSHGVRLVGAQMDINGKTYDVEDVLQSRELSPILSSEGVLLDTKIRVPMRTAGL